MTIKKAILVCILLALTLAQENKPATVWMSGKQYIKKTVVEANGRVRNTFEPIKEETKPNQPPRTQ